MIPRSLCSVSLMTLLLLAAQPALADTKNINTIEELRDEITSAEPGDVIVLAPGTYRLDAKLSIRRAGEAGAPITITASDPAATIIEVDTVEGLYLDAPYWIIERLHFKGVCASDSECEHALHIVGSADHTIVRDSVFESFNAQIKGNGIPNDQGSYDYPDDVLIEGNEFFDVAPRQTGNPVTKIDVVGGRRWVVRRNFIHDFAKAQGDTISYAAFLKGNSRDGLFERNLVSCELAHSGQVRLGLSFGGGGTGPDPICEEGICTPEHQNGVMRNNIIANCPSDVGIYLNEATNTLIEHNTLFTGTGIDVRFAASTATLRDNLVSGRIRERNEGKILSQVNNLTELTRADFEAMFRDPAQLDFTLVDGARIVDKASGSATVTDDFCGQLRAGSFDVGAVEYLTDSPCDTSTIPPADEPAPVEDMGGGAEEMGDEADMGSAAEEMGGMMPDSGVADMGGSDLGAGDDLDASMGDAQMDQGGMESPAQEEEMGSGGSPRPTTEETEGCGGCMSASRGDTPHPLGVMTLFFVALVLCIARRRDERG